MNFRIIDLFVMTTYVAIMFAVFQVDKTFFRQLLFLSFTTIAATFGYFAFPNLKSKILQCSIAAGFGGLIYVGFARIFFEYFYEPTFRATAGFHFSPFLQELSFGPLIASGLGAAFGPLAGSLIKPERYSEVKLQASFKRNRLISCVLFAGALMLAFFAMIDRYKMVSNRDWNVLLAVILAIFVAFTVSWNREPCQKSELLTPLHESPDLEAKS